MENIENQLENYPKSSREAIEKGLKYYYTGRPCKYGHYSIRAANNSYCVECRKSERARERTRKWRLEHLERDKQRSLKWKEENPEYHSTWRKENRGKTRAHLANYRAKKAKATPKWVSWDEIEYIYSLAKEKGLVVDHIVPINSKFVCGLHTGDNLRCIPQSLNSYKSNRYWPDMPTDL